MKRLSIAAFLVTTLTVPLSAGRTVSNAVINRLGPGGWLIVWNNSTGTLHYFADVFGYFRL